LDVQNLVNNGRFQLPNLPTSTGEFTGFLNHQQYFSGSSSASFGPRPSVYLRWKSFCGGSGSESPVPSGAQFFFSMQWKLNIVQFNTLVV